MATQAAVRGFVIFSPTKGVYLGGQRWSFDPDHSARGQHVKKAPVFATSDGEADAKALEAVQAGSTRPKVEGVDDAEFREVEGTGGFADADAVEAGGMPRWGPGVEPPQQEEPRRKKKK